MTIPLNLLAALCPPELREGLDLLSPRQRSTLRARIRQAVRAAQRRNAYSTGHGASKHPRAAYWRAYKRARKGKA